jgi:hypothetical protein
VITSSGEFVDQLRPILKGELGYDLESVEPIVGGGNNRLYCLLGSSSRGDLPERLVAKHYFSHPGDGRNRLDSEFRGLNFLWEQGVREIPQPYLRIESEKKGSPGLTQIGIYEFVEGGRVTDHPSCNRVSDRVVGKTIDLLVRLRQLSLNFQDSIDSVDSGDSDTEKARVADLPLASEACFSLDDLLTNVRARFARFESIKSQPQGCDVEMLQFLNKQLRPAFESFASKAEDKLSQIGIGLGQVLERSERTLSPSDFGFHNTLLSPTGNVTFVDFEYFGWDDPVKMISDFVLHPAMSLSGAQRDEFLSKMVAVFSDQQASIFVDRLRAIFPLYGIKWSLILLNEFLPQALARRQFALGQHDEDILKLKQLKKAQRLLENILSGEVLR